MNFFDKITSLYENLGYISIASVSSTFAWRARELHAIWIVITKKKKGYSKHPETVRWIGKLKALYNRHHELVQEMKKRNYSHKSNLCIRSAIGSKNQDVFINTVSEQIEILKNKNCRCFSSLVL